MSRFEKYHCGVCGQMRLFNEEECVWDQREVKEADGAWCHGDKHDSPYFLCEKHVSYRPDPKINAGRLPCSFCPSCK